MATFFQPSINGIRFHCVSTSTPFGNRIAIHEYPLSDNGFVENMGRKVRKYQITGYVIGDNWELTRDKIIEECERPDAIISLIHPDYGKMEVLCEECTVTESKMNAGKKADFQFVFIEYKKPKLLKDQEFTSMVVKDEAKDAVFSLADAFTAIQNLQNLPQIITDYLTDSVVSLLGVPNVYSLTNSISSLTGLYNTIQTGGFNVPWQFAELVTTFTSSFNNDYSNDSIKIELNDKHKSLPNKKINITPDKWVSSEHSYSTKTFTLTPKQSIDILTGIVNKPMNHPTGTTKINTKKRVLGKQIELLIKGCALIESTIASTYIEFETIQEAQYIWDKILLSFDNLMIVASDIEDFVSYELIKKQKTAFIKDIQKRAPELIKIMTKELDTMTPAIVLSYQYYATLPDRERSSEIVRRNKVKNPLFVPSHIPLTFLKT